MSIEVSTQSDRVVSPLSPPQTKFPQWFHRLPLATRRNFWREFVALLPFSVVVGVLGHSYCAFVARKALHMPDSMLALLMSCHMLGLLLAGPLVGFFSHARKSKALAGVAVFLSTLLIVIGCLPYHLLSQNAGSYLFLFVIFLVQVGAAQITTLRSSIWRSNYPAEHRGKLVVANMFSTTLVGALAIVLFGHAMDQWNLSFRYIYLISGVCGFVGAGLLSRIQVHQESKLLQSLAEKKSNRHRLFAGLVVLKRDRRFRIFMSWMMLHGFATLLVEIVLVIILADEFQLNWISGGAALAAIPLFISGVSSIVWARYFDRHSIFTMRAFSGSIWGLARLLLVIAIWKQSFAIVLISRVVSGIAMGGGQLAWRLGHMEFAPKNQDSLYMGAHVSLTGIRGILAPFVGIALYKLIGPVYLFLGTAALQFLSSAAFYLMPRFINSESNERPIPCSSSKAESR